MCARTTPTIVKRKRARASLSGLNTTETASTTTTTTTAVRATETATARYTALSTRPISIGFLLQTVPARAASTTTATMPLKATTMNLAVGGRKRQMIMLKTTSSLSSSSPLPPSLLIAALLIAIISSGILIDTIDAFPTPASTLLPQRTTTTPTPLTTTTKQHPNQNPFLSRQSQQRTHTHQPTALSAAAAASAWLFTPDRTPTLLVNTVSTTTSAALDAATTAATTAATAATIGSTIAAETITHTIYKAPVLSLAISFLLGGLFFSTVAAFVAAVYAVGRENMRRVREVGGILWRRNWSVVKLTILVTRDILLGKEKLSGFKNRFPAALQTLKDGFNEVKRVFTESVDAIKKETQMYSAAVGLPGLIPIQYIFDRITPLTLTAPFESALQDALAQTARDNSQIRKLILKKFSMGDRAPRILEARLFDLGKQDMAFDLELLWKSEVRADLEIRVSSLGGAKIPVTIQNLRFEGPVRIIVVGLMTKEPGYEALLISLPRPPQIGFDLKVAGGLITQIPWLRNELAKMLDDAVAKEVLWPRRAVVSAPSPFKSKPFLNPMQMLSFMRDDPLLRRERELMASLPDDFRSNYEASSKEDIPDFDIRQVDGSKSSTGMNGNYNNDNDDDLNGDGGGTSKVVPGWKKWGRLPPKKSVLTPNALQMMAKSLQEENAVATRHVTIVKGMEEEKTLAQRMLSNVLIPKSLVSYASREMF